MHAISGCYPKSSILRHLNRSIIYVINRHENGGVEVEQIRAGRRNNREKNESPIHLIIRIENSIYSFFWEKNELFLPNRIGTHRYALYIYIYSVSRHNNWSRPVPPISRFISFLNSIGSNSLHLFTRLDLLVSNNSVSSRLFICVIIFDNSPPHMPVPRNTWTCVDRYRNTTASLFIHQTFQSFRSEGSFLSDLAHLGPFH